MARELRVYKGFIPNSDTTLHLCCDDLINYVVYMDDENYATNVTIDNYRINANVAKLKLTSNLESFYDQVTYLIDWELVDGTITYWRCYYVKSATIQSGYVVFQLSIDYWGTYFYYVRRSPIQITKANLQIEGKGVYDDIKATDGIIEYTNAYEASGAEGNGGWFESRTGVVFLLQYNVSQAVFGNDKITKTELFYVNVKTLKDLAIAQNSDFESYSAIDIAVDMIGGIYGATASIGNVDAQVIKAWLLDTKGIVTAPQEHGINVVTKSTFTEGAEKTIKVYHVYPSKEYRHITIENYDINKIYYAGTFNNGLKLKRFTSADLDYYTWYIITTDDVKVIVQQGEEQKDITNAFSVSLTTNAGVTTGIRRVAEALDMSMGAYSRGLGNFAKGGPTLAGLGFANDILGMVPQEAYEKIIGGGDGATTFYQPQNTSDLLSKLQTPYILTTYTSIHDEEKHARLFGANYDYFISNFMDLNNYSLIGSPLSTGLRSYKYVQGAIYLDMNNGGIPQDAYNTIINMVAKGVYIAFID